MRPFMEKAPRRKDTMMKIINGVFASAKIFTADAENPVDSYAEAQIRMLCNHEALEGCKIRIMPDVHPGKVGTIGFTMTVRDKIMPNLVGIDIGCGIALARIRQKKIEYQKLDSVIRDGIPSGFGVRKQPHHYADSFDFSRLCCHRSIREKKAALSLGTLGGGNHFIEADRDESGNLYVVIHSGSRHLGKEVAEFYLNQGQRELKARGKEIPYELTYLEGSLMEDYLHDLQVVQEFAALNRAAMMDVLMKEMKWKTEERYDCIHNYVQDTEEERILRKGAISAQTGERLVIPINMRDGIILGTGKGNTEWNCSAPHGAGRILKREEAGRNFTVSAYKAQMKGIYSSCINRDTLDEAPFAYRSLEQIRGAISETAKIDKIITPVYNFKAGRDQ